MEITSYESFLEHRHVAMPVDLAVFLCVQWRADYTCRFVSNRCSPPPQSEGGNFCAFASVQGQHWRAARPGKNAFGRNVVSDTLLFCLNQDHPPLLRYIGLKTKSALKKAESLEMGLTAQYELSHLISVNVAALVRECGHG